MTTEVIDRKEAETNPPKDSAYWLLELQAAHEREKVWRGRAEKVVDRYRDEREATSSQRKVNILWSNTEVMEASLYTSPPNPDVRRRFGTSDRVGRNAALALERSLSYCVDAHDLDSAIKLALEDSLLPGRGVCWEVYEPTLGKDEAGNDAITDQETRTEWVYWEDYREGQARSWDKVPWVARRHLWTKKQVEDADLDVKDGMAFNHSTAPASVPDEQGVLKRAEIWEIWDKVERQRVYVSEGYPKILKTTPDPYKLKGFFPCAEPLRAVLSTKTRVPIPHFTLYQDQADELDRLTDRLYRLTEFIKWAGAYDSAEGANAELKNLATALDGDFIPVKNWSQFSEKGGLGGVFQEINIEMLSAVVERLENRRAILIQTIYEVTGISDIIRGATDPRETKGAQTLKAQFGSMRMQKLQKEVQRFIRDVMRIKAEIIAEHFSQQKIAEISQIELPTKEELLAQQMAAQQQAMQQQMQAAATPPAPPAQGQAPAQPAPQEPAAAAGAGPQEGPPVTWDDVMAVLRSDDRRAYKVDIETDQTAFQNAEEEKKARIEFMQAFGDILEKSMVAIQANPALLPLMRENVLFTMQAFKVGRVLEEAVEDTFTQLAQQLKQQQPKPSPDEMKVQAQIEQMKAQLQMDMQRLQMEMKAKMAELQMKSQEHAMDMQFKREENALDMQTKQQDQMVDMAIKTQGAQIDLESKKAAADQALSLNEQKAEQQAAIMAQRAKQKPERRPGA